MWGSTEEPSCSWRGGEASTQVPAQHLHWDVVLTDLHVCTRCQLLPRCMAAARARSQCRDNTSRTRPSCSPSLTAPQNTPSSTPHLCQPQALSPFHSGIGQQLMEKLPPALVPSPALPASSWWDRRVGGKTGLRLACPSVCPSCGSPAPGADVSAPGSRAVGGLHRSYCIKNNTAEHKFITDKCDSQEELTSPSLNA